MKIPANKIDAFVNNPDSNIKAVLIYGPDAGLVSERANNLAKKIVKDLSDPFLVSDIEFNNIKDDTAKLADEINSISMIGGRKLIRVRDAENSIPKTLGDSLSDIKSNNFTIFTAGDLPSSSSMRKFFESEKNVAALPCYKDDGGTIRQVVSTKLREIGMNIEPAALDLLCNNFSGDRLVILSEVEKLIIYMGDEKTVRYEDALLCVADSSELSLDQICNAAASRDAKQINIAMQKALADDVQPIAIIRSTINYFTKLYNVKAKVENGMMESQALSALRPPVFFKQLPVMQKHLSMWNCKSLARILSALNDLENDCKTTGNPAEILTMRFFAIIPLAVR